MRAGVAPDAPMNRRRGRLKIGEPTKGERIAKIRAELEEHFEILDTFSDIRFDVGFDDS